MAAILFAAALFLVGLAPFALAYWRPGARWGAATLYAILVSGLALYHTGVTFGTVQPLPDSAAGPAAVENTREMNERCSEAIGLAEQGGIILDNSNPERLVVDGTLWNQMPDFGKQALIMCVNGSQEGGQARGTVEVVEK